MPDPKHLATVRKILQEVPLIDGHNDLPWQYRKHSNATERAQRNRRHGDKSPERAYPPIDGLEVRDGDVAPPETPQSALAAQNEAQTASLVAGLREVFGPLVDSLLAAKGLSAPKQAR